MNRLWVFFLVIVWLVSSLVQASPPDQNQADSQAIREIQALDQSHLDFDFFEDNSSNNAATNTQSSEAALLEALELLEQSPDEENHFEEDILKSLETANGLSDDDSELSSEMDEEIESSLDQDISDELQGAFEDLFDE
ncbi:MAG: hypothetical protein V7785_24445 [Bermanella sp.]